MECGSKCFSPPRTCTEIIKMPTDYRNQISTHSSGLARPLNDSLSNDAWRAARLTVQQTGEAGPVMLAAEQPAVVFDRRAYRLTSIDMLRGLVIVVMALDHVRDYLSAYHQNPTDDPNVSLSLFATRWITHFCAPVFVFLAGTSVGLMADRKTPLEVRGFLLKRGLWLILVEVFVISTAWTLAPLGIEAAPFHGHVFIVMQVIWVIGASMVILAGLQLFGQRTCLLTGAAIVLGHNLLDPIWPAGGGLGWPLWVALHSPMSKVAGPFGVWFAYPLLPWIGVMLLGYGTVGIFRLPPARRNATLLRAGLVLTAAFVVLRALDVYGDPHGWQVQTRGIAATMMSFLNTTKYPPSLQYLLMTLGPRPYCAHRLTESTVQSRMRW
jgi:uncharacterized membrane protein